MVGGIPRGRTVALVTAVLLLLGLPSSATAQTPPPPDGGASPRAIGPVITVVGKGFGHGRGMGQYGAYGYAVDRGWGWQQILDHYYEGTSNGALQAGWTITTELRELNNAPAIAVHHRGNQLTSNAVVGQYSALQAVPLGGGQWDIYSAASCAGPWTLVNDNVNPDPVDVSFGIAGIAPDPATASINGMLGLCEPDNQVRYYRGALFAKQTSGGTRAVNDLPMEQYLRGVVPRESPASWGDAGGGRGMNALAAQSVAARSYAARQDRYAWANTCDTQDCQVYGGAFVQEPDGTLSLPLERPQSDQAIAATAGVVRLLGDDIASTEFSSSTGGYTEGWTDPANKGPFLYPIKEDVGDATSINPNHDWKTTIAKGSVEARYPEIGALVSIDVSERNGFGQYGGRVRKVVLRGTAGSRTITGNDFRVAFKVKSDWFAVDDSATCGSGGPPLPPEDLPPAAPTTFHPLTPTRVLDTRDGTGAIGAPLAAGCTLALTVTGAGGVPQTGVRAVSLNVTATNASEDGYITAYPCGATPPPTSSLNYRPGVDVANLVTVPVGVGGQVCLFAYRRVDVLADVAGWFGTDTAGARFTGLSPSRLLDTRDGTGVNGATSRVAAGGVETLDVAGRSGVPGSAATAVVLNLTATQAAGPGYLSAYPCDRSAYASAVNYQPGADVANQVVVPLDGAGRVCILSYAGSHVIADVLGYYGAPSALAGDRYTPVTPSRVIDTRVALGSAGRVGAGQVLTVGLLGVGGVPASGVDALTFNLTAADPAAAGYLSAYPCGGTPPNASNVSYAADRAAANLVTVSVGGGGRVCVLSYAASDVVVDVSGYFAD